MRRAGGLPAYNGRLGRFPAITIKGYLGVTPVQRDNEMIAQDMPEIILLTS